MESARVSVYELLLMPFATTIRLKHSITNFRNTMTFFVFFFFSLLLLSHSFSGALSFRALVVRSITYCLFERYFSWLNIIGMVERDSTAGRCLRYVCHAQSHEQSLECERFARQREKMRRARHTHTHTHMHRQISIGRKSHKLKRQTRSNTECA